MRFKCIYKEQSEQEEAYQLKSQKHICKHASLFLSNMPFKAKTNPTEQPDEEMLKRLIMEHDRNGDHVLSKHELKEAFKELGSRFPSLRTHMAMRFADKDKSGYVDDGELNGLVAYIMKLGYSVK
uniref:EF-hand domain-containing protein n=1 Tax=Kalanchoe fedtschenkoi TaxID=63787 RepID=A0A7N0V7U7_KALFE